MSRRKRTARKLGARGASHRGRSHDARGLASRMHAGALLAAIPQWLARLELRWQPELHLPLGGLLLLTAIAYWPAFFAGFIWDDNIFYDSEAVRTWSGIRELWLDLGSVGSESHYWPVLYSSLWLDHKLWAWTCAFTANCAGDFNPAGFHFTNILLHGINTALLWRLLARMQVPGAWFIAAFFAVHPMRVEAVAWVIARKDLLAALFYFLAVERWLRFRERGRSGDYLALLAFYTLALLSKTIAVTLPAALLLWTWWRHGRISRRDLLQTAPLFLIAIGISIYGLHFFTARTLIEFEYSFAERLIIAAKALWFYAGKMLWPHPLLFIYHHWDVNPARLLNWLPLLAALGLAAGLWLARHRIGRGPLAGALFFAITLSPVLGFVDNSYMKFAFVADRYQYLPGAGLLAMLVGAAAHLCRRLADGAVSYGAGTLAALLLASSAALTFERAQLFQDKVALFENVTANNPGAYEAYYNLGTFLMERGRADDAVDAFTTGLEYEPRRIKMYVNLSSALMELGRREEAEAVLRRAIQREPDNFDELKDPYGARYEAAGVRTNLGMVLMELERPADAEAALRRALELDSGMLQAERNLSVLLREQGRYDEALNALQRVAKREPSAELYSQMAAIADQGGREAAAAHYTSRAIALRPEAAGALNQRAAARFSAGDFEAAARLYRRLAAAAPDSAGAHVNVALSLLQLSREPEAAASLERALAIDPQHPQALNQLAALHFNAKRYADALALFRRSVAAAPGDAEAHSNLGSALAQTGRLQEAAQSFEHALQLDPDFHTARKNLELVRQKLGGER